MKCIEWTFECRIDFVLPNIEEKEEAGALRTKRKCVCTVCHYNEEKMKKEVLPEESQ